VAVVSLKDAAQRLLLSQLAPHLRYRCVVVQSADLSLLRNLHDHLQDLITAQGATVQTVDGQRQFDTVGALSCQELTTQIGQLSVDKYLILSGPLHFLDYWSPTLRNSFWSFLATITRGPGIIVLDAPRVGDSEDTFRVLGRIPDTDARLLKSRLAITQDGLV
jgi:hypothetical protein